MSVRITPHAAVRCEASLHLSLAAPRVWGQIRDFHRYARQDLFHANVSVEGNMPRAGAGISLCHRYAGVRVQRIGRILTWREGTGYSFSDLSRRGPRAGFPHIFQYRIEPRSADSCDLYISVRGRWTARWIPRWAAQLWLRWVFAQIVRSVENQLMVYALWRRRRNG